VPPITRTWDLNRPPRAGRFRADAASHIMALLDNDQASIIAGARGGLFLAVILQHSDGRDDCASLTAQPANEKLSVSRRCTETAGGGPPTSAAEYRINPMPHGPRSGRLAEQRRACACIDRRGVVVVCLSVHRDPKHHARAEPTSGRGFQASSTVMPRIESNISGRATPHPHDVSACSYPDRDIPLLCSDKPCCATAAQRRIGQNKKRKNSAPR